MDFWGAMGVLRRRWYVVVPALVVAAALALATFVGIPTQYTSTGVIVLTSPQQGGTFTQSVRPEDIKRINPLLAFDSSLNTTAQIFIQIIQDPKTEDQLGVTRDETLTITNGNVDQRGPFIVVTATGIDVDATRGLVGRVLDRVGTELVDRQRALQAPTSTFITAQVLVQPTEPLPQIGGKLRFTGAAALLGIFLAFAAPFAYESISTARRRRRIDDDSLLDGDVQPDIARPVPVGPPPVPAAALSEHPQPNGSAVPGLKPSVPETRLRPRPSPRPHNGRPRIAAVDAETVTVPAVSAPGAGETNGHRGLRTAGHDGTS